jgi:DNA-binding MarR family transcriptional regulator
MENHLAVLGLRIRHYSVLQTLSELGSASQQDLGVYLRIDGATMVATIDDLESLGYVARKRGTDDRRRYIVSILPEGERVLKEVDALMTSLDEELLADVTARQRNELKRVMRKLSEGETLIRAFDEVRGR